MKKPFQNKGMIAGIFLALFFTNNAKGSAEEIIGKILFEPERTWISGRVFTYRMDTNNDRIDDTPLELADIAMNREIVDRLMMYLTPNTEILFDNAGLKPFDTAGAKRVLGFWKEGDYKELTLMFSQRDVERYFPWLYNKLVREGRTR